MCIIAAAAKHVLAYLQNGGERISPDHYPVSATETFSNNKSKKKVKRKKGKKCKEPMEYSEDISDCDVMADLNLNKNIKNKHDSDSDKEVYYEGHKEERGIEKKRVEDDGHDGGTGMPGMYYEDVSYATEAWLEVAHTDSKELQTSPTHERTRGAEGTHQMSYTSPQSVPLPSSRPLNGSPMKNVTQHKLLHHDRAHDMQDNTTHNHNIQNKSHIHTIASTHDQPLYTTTSIPTFTSTQPFTTRSSINQELSGIAASRDDLFTDSVASFDSANITRDEFILLMEKMETVGHHTK
jgi:hypothetical protein